MCHIKCFVTIPEWIFISFSASFLALYLSGGHKLQIWYTVSLGANYGIYSLSLLILAQLFQKIQNGRQNENIFRRISL